MSTTENGDTKRINLIQMGKDAISAAKAPFKVRKEKKQLESRIIDIEENIAELEEEIHNIKSDKDVEFNVDKLLEAIDDLALAERRLKQSKAVLKELF